MRRHLDALVEVLTNADDDYVRKHLSGIIEIDVERRRKGSPTRVCVRDFSKGLTQADMDTKLKRLGGRHDSGMTTGENVRGTNSRGAKDVAALGTVTYESITGDGVYAKCEIRTDGTFHLWDEEPATDDLRKAVGITQGTGTLVGFRSTRLCGPATFEPAEEAPRIGTSPRPAR